MSMTSDKENPPSPTKSASAHTLQQRSLSEKYKTFLRNHSIDASIFEVDPDTLPRYIRLNTLASNVISESQLQEEIAVLLPENTAVMEPVQWCPRAEFYSIPSSVSVAKTKAYQNGQIYGMDISSGYCVSILDPQPGDHVLDLCCAPGAKLALIAELMQCKGSLTGVDISHQRLMLCRKLLYKHNILARCAKVDETTKASEWKCRLIQADGCVFRGKPHEKIRESARNTTDPGSSKVSIILDSEDLRLNDPKLLLKARLNKSSRARMNKRKRENEKIFDSIPSNDDGTSTPIGESDDSGEGSCALYDRVLVDAECTHDGSFKHLLKSGSEEQWETYMKEYLNTTHVEQLMTIQLDLLRNGFRMLKEGGTLVYSTCSLSLKQNEGVVETFLAETSSAKLIPLQVESIRAEAGNIPGTIRFSPLHGTSGLFVAKMIKTGDNKKKFKA